MTYEEEYKDEYDNLRLNEKIIKTQSNISRRLFLIERNNLIHRDFVSKTNYKTTNAVLSNCLSQLESCAKLLKDYAANQPLRD